MSAEDFRVEYLTGELEDKRRRLNDVEKQLQEAGSAVAALQYQREKYKAIVEMLEVAYKVRSSDHKEATKEKA